MSVYKIAGELIIGSRLKRLSERFLSDVSKVYKSFDIPFETSYFPVFYLLDIYGTIKISDVAHELEITRSGASQMVNALEKKGLIRYDTDKEDKRVRTISFTPCGTALLKEIKMVWTSIQNSYRTILEEGDNSRYFFQALEEIEENISRKTLFERVSQDLMRRRLLTDIRFFPYDMGLEAAYRELALSWLLDNDFFHSKDTDFINRVAQTVESGQAVVEVAAAQDRVSGAYYAALDGKAAEIKVFAVHGGSLDLDLQKALLKRLCDTLEKKGVRSASIRINRRQAPLIKLFRSAGFAFMGLEPNRNKETGVVLTRCLPQGSKKEEPAKPVERSPKNLYNC